MRKLLLAVPLLLVLGSCEKKFFDINQNPNTATEASVTADLILPYAMVETGRITTTFYSGLGKWMGYWSIGSNYATGDEAKYNITTNYGNGTWTAYYDNIFDYHKAQEKAEATGMDFYAGIAKIMKAHNFQALVDIFNNVPYSQALSIQTHITPAYDKGADIYKDLLKQITEGINLIKSADVNKNTRLFEADIMFHGDKTKWAKFGNSLKLRLLIHQSQVPGFNPAAEIAIITAEGSGFLGAGETAGVNPGLPGDPGYKTDKPNPFWATYAFNKDGQTYPNNFSRANTYALNLMKNLGDERYKYFYRPVRPGNSFSGQWRGVDYGNPNDPGQIYNETQLSDIGGAPTAAGGPSGLAKSVSMDAWVFTSFESLFLQAEAQVRGWLPGDAHATYIAAVRESFVWLGVPNAIAAADTYLSSLDAKVAWPASTADRIKVIAWQKYFAFNGNNHLESWNDFRRLDIVTPAISIDPGRISNTIPIRWLYPIDEYSYNAANVEAQGTINQFTSRVFWDIL